MPASLTHHRKQLPLSENLVLLHIAVNRQVSSYPGCQFDESLHRLIHQDYEAGYSSPYRRQYPPVHLVTNLEVLQEELKALDTNRHSYHESQPYLYQDQQVARYQLAQDEPLCIGWLPQDHHPLNQSYLVHQLTCSALPNPALDEPSLRK